MKSVSIHGIVGQRTPWRHDPRSKKFSHHRFFGTTTPYALPETLNRPRRLVENQKASLRCTGYGSAVNGGYIHNIRFHPDWQAAKIGQLQGQSVDDNGGDPNAAMRSQRDCGYLPFNLETVRTLASNTLQNTGWQSYDPALDKHAADYRVAGFVSVDGPYDLFDDIKSALYMAYNATTGTGPTVQAFGKWYDIWTPAKGGIIPTSYDGGYTYHHWIFIDFCSINGVQYLVAQNSGGDWIGDKGYYYFPREVVNREFGVWGTTLKIVKPLTPAQIEMGKREDAIGRIQRLIYDVWFAISEWYIVNRP